MWWCVRSSSALAALASLALALLLAGPAAAQREQAQELAGQARDAFVAGEYVRALELFDQAFALDPHPVIAYNQARCYEELGDLPRALERFRTALDLGPAANVVSEIEAKIAEIEAVLVEQGVDIDQLDPESYVAVARVTVTSLPEGASVTIDGEGVGLTPVDSVFVAPGEHRVEILLEGYQPHVRTVDLEAGRNATVHVSLRRLEAVSDYTPPEPGYLELTGPRRDMTVLLDEEVIGRTPLSGTAIAPGRYRVRVRHEEFDDWTTTVTVASGETVSLYADAERRPELETGWDAGDWGVAALVAGGVFVATGTVFGVLALADADRYDRQPDATDRDDARESALTEALVADVTLGVGAALLVTSALLLLVVDGADEGEEDSEDLVRLQVGPGPSGQGWGVSLGGRF